MKLAFTTLGCPDWTLDRIIAAARDYGYDGVDFRGYVGTLDICALPEFSARAAETADRFRAAGLAVPCFSTSAKAFMSKPEERAAQVAEVRRYAALCPVFGAQYLRIFGGGIGATPREEAIAVAAPVLTQMADAAAEFGAQIVIETHDAWTRGADLRALLDAANDARVGVLWDVHHPYRQSGEPMAATWELLGPRVRYTHWKDSVPAEKGHRLFLVGEGDVPLAEAFGLLKQGGYDGWLTLEWEKRWHPDLPEADVAFPGFVRVMRGFGA